MHRIRNSPPPDKVILIHNGALGDFLLFWPTAWTVRQAWPQARMIWAGKTSYSHWLEPLGCEPCPAPLRSSLDRLFVSDVQPEALEQWLILWPFLTLLPPISPMGNCCFLQGIVRGSATSPRERYLAELAARGVTAGGDAQAAFRELFAGQRCPGERVLLFPGAGHPLKQWPMDRFVELSRRIRAVGRHPLFVLGPAELERGLVPENEAWVAPSDLRELEALILSARAVVGADTGPMHLAGMLGVPGISLFGPTRFSQWGPPGMLEVNLGLSCAPCTQDCADLDCASPRCMEELPARRVMEALLEAL